MTLTASLVGRFRRAGALLATATLLPLAAPSARAATTPGVAYASIERTNGGDATLFIYPFDDGYVTVYRTTNLTASGYADATGVINALVGSWTATGGVPIEVPRSSGTNEFYKIVSTARVGWEMVPDNWDAGPTDISRFVPSDTGTALGVTHYFHTMDRTAGGQETVIVNPGASDCDYTISWFDDTTSSWVTSSGAPWEGTALAGGGWTRTTAASLVAGFDGFLRVESTCPVLVWDGAAYQNAEGLGVSEDGYRIGDTMYAYVPCDRSVAACPSSSATGGLTFVGVSSASGTVEVSTTPGAAPAYSPLSPFSVGFEAVGGMNVSTYALYRVTGTSSGARLIVKADASGIGGPFDNSLVPSTDGGPNAAVGRHFVYDGGGVSYHHVIAPEAGTTFTITASSTTSPPNCTGSPANRSPAATSADDEVFRAQCLTGRVIVDADKDVWVLRSQGYSNQAAYAGFGSIDPHANEPPTCSNTCNEVRACAVDQCWTVTLTDPDDDASLLSIVDVIGPTDVTLTDLGGGTWRICSADALSPGTHSYTLQIRDSEVTTKCDACVTAIDSTPPVLSGICPPSIIMATPPDCCAPLDPFAFDMPTFSDDCGGTVTVTADWDESECACEGVHLVRWSAVDASGNRTTCDAEVTVTGCVPGTQGDSMVIPFFREDKGTALNAPGSVLYVTNQNSFPVVADLAFYNLAGTPLTTTSSYPTNFVVNAYQTVRFPQPQTGNPLPRLRSAFTAGPFAGDDSIAFLGNIVITTSPVSGSGTTPQRLDARLDVLSQGEDLINPTGFALTSQVEASAELWDDHYLSLKLGTSANFANREFIVVTNPLDTPVEFELYFHTNGGAVLSLVTDTSNSGQYPVTPYAVVPAHGTFFFNTASLTGVTPTGMTATLVDGNAIVVAHPTSETPDPVLVGASVRFGSNSESNDREPLDRPNQGNPLFGSDLRTDSRK